MLVNLVGNAIKFTERGQILVQVEATSKTADGTVLHYFVSDSGIGIPADKQQAIFEPFKQADGSTTRRFGGTGLGLAISSTLVELMGGRIWVESEPLEGSTFHFTVHLGVTDARPEPRRRQPDRSAGARSSTTTRVNRRVLQDLLLRWRMRPTVVDERRRGAARADEARERRRTVRARAARRQHAGDGRLRGRAADQRRARARRRDDHDAELVGSVRRERALPRGRHRARI